jgi:hypothetical protein
MDINSSGWHEPDEWAGISCDHSLLNSSFCILLILFLCKYGLFFLISGKSTCSYEQQLLNMAGILERLHWPQKKALGDSSPAPRVDRRIMELQTAKEILAEIFGVRISDVEEMILNRYEDASYWNTRHQEADIWPQEFWVA